MFIFTNLSVDAIEIYVNGPSYIIYIIKFSQLNKLLAKLYTVYCKLFEVEKFRSFHSDRKTFPAKHFCSGFKLECHGQTLQEENRTVNVIL